MAGSDPDHETSGPVWGSDLVADLLDELGFAFVAFNPGETFRGLEESIVNYADDTPQVIQTTHEGLSVSIAHGYAKAADDPACCVLHNVVGTLHGAMGLYNAYVDQAPVLALAGGGPLRKQDRGPLSDWLHTAIGQGSLVRDYVKWDDQPMGIHGVPDSLVRAVQVSDTAPKGPVYVTLGQDVQECRIDEAVDISGITSAPQQSTPHPDPDAVESAAQILAEAEHPVIVVGRYGTNPDAVTSLIALADTLGAAVVDPRKQRYNFPNTHPLSVEGDAVLDTADAVLGLDVRSPEHALAYDDHDQVDLDLVTVGPQDTRISGPTTDHGPLQESGIRIPADSHATVTALNDAIASRVSATDARERSKAIGRIHREQRGRWAETVEETWDEEPVSLPRLAAEIWTVIEDERWVVVNGSLRGWIHRIWDIDDFDAYIGGKSGAGGKGYGIGAAIGGALAYRDADRIPINLQPDGDLLYYPGGLWTIAHYDIPVLTIMHNNRGYHNSTLHRMELAAERGRDASEERARIGTGLRNPTPDYAALAESMGINGYGPIHAPGRIGSALQDAVEDVKGGEPALVDVIGQGR